MSRHRRSLGLLTILTRLGRQRDPTLWNVPCVPRRSVLQWRRVARPTVADIQARPTAA